MFVLAWAISSQAILYKDPSILSLDTIGSMLTRSYWPMFGQYNFQEFQNSVLSLVQNNFCQLSGTHLNFDHVITFLFIDATFIYPNGTTGVLAISPVAPYLLPFMLAGFIIFTVLILFNMVIAMFKYQL